MSNISYLLNHYDFNCKESLVIQRQRDVVYKAIWDFKAWPNILKLVKKIKTIYDDGTYQEFLMDVFNGEKGIIKVRSIRKCGEQEIDFFQPVPPVFLKYHAGKWIFNSKEDSTKCELTCYHFWNLSPSAQEYYATDNHEFIEKKVSEFLKDHAKKALISWKKYLENKNL
ncbi:MAG: SRPBCC family protein [bacterium]